MNGVPDIVSDPVTEAAKALGVPNTEMVFMAAARDAGFTNPEDVAAHRFNQWKHEGYNILPSYVKSFCLRQIFLGRQHGSAGTESGRAPDLVGVLRAARSTKIHVH